MSPILLFAIGAALASFVVGRQATLAELEQRTLDWRMRFRKSDPTFAREVGVVLIDDAALASYPYRSPIPRPLLARLIEQLTIGGARRIGVDVFLKSPTWEAEDAALEKAIRDSGRVVVVSTFRDGDRESDPPAARFLNAAQATGLAEFSVESDDQVIRRGRAFFMSSSEPVPSLAWTLFALERGGAVLPNKLVDLREWRRQCPPGVALDDAGGFWINYGKVMSLPASLLLTHPDAGALFKGKTVLVGAAFADQTDFHATPFTARDPSAPRSPGVEIHANLLATLLDGRGIRVLEGLPALGLALILILPIAWVTGRFHPLAAAGASAGLVLAQVIVSFLVFERTRVALPMVPNWIAAGTTFVGILGYRTLTEGRQRRWLRNTLQMYLPPAYVRILANEPQRLLLGGEERTVTMLFTDIEGYTSISEGKTPPELVSLLNRYFERMTGIVMKHEGTLDKYIGDAIMAFWNAPLEQAEHAWLAAQAALEMAAFTGDPPGSFRTRIGLNTGRAIVGNIGSNKRFNYTVIGDEVNLASRLEGANKAFGTGVMMSESTYELIRGRVHVRQLDLIRVKGRKQPVCVYELLGLESQPLSESKVRMLKAYEEGWAAYRRMEWQMAGKLFKVALEDGEDTVCRIHLERTRRMQAEPPGKDWNGVYTLASK